MSAPLAKMRAVFEEMVDQPPSQWSVLLDDACSGDPELRSSVEQLLRAHVQGGSLLDHPVLGDAPTIFRHQSEISTDSVGTDDLHLPGPRQDFPLDFLSPDADAGALGRLGSYTVTGIIGRGGMGVVLKARDVKLNRVVAVKVLAPELASNPTARQRFVREAQAAAAVVHQHVVTIHAVDEERLPYLVMEHIDGQSLQDKIDREGHLELEEIVRIGQQIAAGLAAAHSRGLIHRDIKPANVLLSVVSGPSSVGDSQNPLTTDHGQMTAAKLTDFGLARLVDDASLTRSGEVAGTPQYMSPEQALGQPVDQRSDLFSLGSVLYAMCTGHSPFRADSTVAALRRVCDDKPHPIREINPGIPYWLCQFIDRLLTKDPAERIQTATEVVNLLSCPPNSEVGIQNSRSSPPARSPLANPKSGHPRKWVIQNPKSLAAALAFSLLASVAVWVIIKNRHGQEVARVQAPDGGSVTVTADPQTNGGDPIRPPGPGTQVPGASTSTAPPTSLPIEQLPPGETKRWQAHAGFVDHLTLSPDGKTLASSSKDRAIRLWDAGTGNLLHSLESHTDIADVAAFSPDGTLVASGSHDKTVKWWDVASGKLLGTFAGHTNRVRAVVFAPDGKSLFTAGEDCTLRRVVLSTGEDKRLATFPFPIGVRSLALNGRTLAVSTWGDSLVRFWDTETETEKSTIMIGGVVAEALAFEPKGQLLAEGGYDVIHLALWDSSGMLKFNLKGHTRNVTGAAFAPDARLLVSVGGQWNRTDLPGEIKIWDATTGQELANLGPGPGCVFAVVVAADGKTCFTAHHDGTIRQWRLPRTSSASP